MKLCTSQCPEYNWCQAVNNVGRNLWNIKTSRASFCSCPLSSLPPLPRIIHWFLDTCYNQRLWLCVYFLSHWKPLPAFFASFFLSIDYVIREWKRIWRRFEWVYVCKALTQSRVLGHPSLSISSCCKTRLQLQLQLRGTSGAYTHRDTHSPLVILTQSTSQFPVRPSITPVCTQGFSLQNHRGASLHWERKREGTERETEMKETEETDREGRRGSTETSLIPLQLKYWI